MKFKQVLSIVLIIGAFILFNTANTVCYFFSSSLLIIAFSILGALDFLIQLIFQMSSIEKRPHKIVIYTLLIFAIMIIEAKASTIIPPIKINSLEINKSLEFQLTSIFDKYSIANDSDSNLVQLSCELENRFTYILASISSIEETKRNSAKRQKNLIIRKKNYVKNIGKINQRCKNANEKQLDVIIPNIDIPEVDVNQAYKRILIYASQIKRDIDNSSCNNSCKYKNIDNASYQIVKEIDNLRIKFDNRNFELSQNERKFDNLEEIQRLTENKLVVKGF